MLDKTKLAWDTLNPGNKTAEVEQKIEMIYKPNIEETPSKNINVNQMILFWGHLPAST